MPPPPFEIRREKHGAARVLAARGEVDLATAAGLHDALAQAAVDDGDFWLDLSEVEFMDSTGLTALVSCHQAVNDGRHRFVIICPAGPVWRALEISGLHVILPLYPSRAAAGAT